MFKVGEEYEVQINSCSKYHYLMVKMRLKEVSNETLNETEIFREASEQGCGREGCFECNEERHLSDGTTAATSYYSAVMHECEFVCLSCILQS